MLDMGNALPSSLYTFQRIVAMRAISFFKIEYVLMVEAMFRRSLVVCAPSISGPIEIMSNEG